MWDIIIKTLMFLLQTLLCVFSSCGDVKNADCVFHRILERDTISRDSIISAYSQNGLCEESLSIFQKMRLANLKPNSRALSCLVSSCSSVDNLRWGMVIRSLIVKLGLDSCVANTLITLYSESGRFKDSKLLYNCGMIRAAERITHTMPERNEVTWNALIGGSVENEEPQAALEAYKSMRKDGISVNYITTVSILGSWSALNDLLRVRMSIHPHIVLMGFGQDDYVKNSLTISFIFNEFASETAVSWNVLIATNAHQGNGEGALKLFVKMHHSGVEFDHFSFSGGLAGSNLATLEEGQQISGFPRLCYFKEAIETFNEIDQIGEWPEHVTFVSLLFNHGGVIDEGLSYFCFMMSEFGVTQGIQHCVYIIDLLGRSGRLRNLKLNNIKKKPACSWVKVNNKGSTFGVADKFHPQADQIYEKLEDLKQIIRETGYIPDTSFSLHDTDEEQKEQNLWNHSEKVALAFALTDQLLEYLRIFVFVVIVILCLNMLVKLYRERLSLSPIPVVTTAIDAISTKEHFDLFFFLHVPRTRGGAYFHCFLRKLYASTHEFPVLLTSKPDCWSMITFDDYSMMCNLPKVVTRLLKLIDRVFSAYEFS
ncbi:hypothetical protein MKW92_024964 [Papaver armeniacum]|nr:hypothetical protein MKW92_024964 [Papaver armeniacum]